MEQSERTKRQVEYSTKIQGNKAFLRAAPAKIWYKIMGKITIRGLNSLSQNLTVLTAPSEREPLAHPQTLHFSRKLYRHAKGPIPEGAVCVADWGSSGENPFRHRLRRCHLPQGDGFSGGGKLCGSAERRPLGGAVERSETEGVLWLTACALSVFASQIHLSQRERQEHRRKLSHYT